MTNAVAVLSSDIATLADLVNDLMDCLDRLETQAEEKENNR